MLEPDSKSSAAGRPGIAFATLVRDKRVLVALADGVVTPDMLREHGARDVLMLEREGSPTPTRTGNHVRQRYRRLADVRTNNCNLAILHGKAAFALTEKRKFARFSHVLVPLGWPQVAARLGLLRYGRRRCLVLTGTTEIICQGRRLSYAVLETHVHLRDQRRQYGPTGFTPLELMQRLAGLNYAALRWSEMMEAGQHEGDIDILVSQDSLPGLLERYEREVGTYPLDIYTHDGQGGYGYKSVPYFTPGLAKGVLESASISQAGIRVAAPHWRFLAFCYHLMFHNKSEHVCPGTREIHPGTFHKPHYYQELERLAHLAGQPVPRSFDDIENLLRDADVLPSLDLIGFYSNKNPFLKKRYFDHPPVKTGLATFFVRDFGQGTQPVPELRASLLKHFEILAEGPVDPSIRERVIQGVRGGNWADAAAPGGKAEPVYWWVCWDPAPRSPSARTRRKHPRVDNENIRLKDDLRRDHGTTANQKSLRVIHSSDNSLEALDHLEHLGLKNHPEIARRLTPVR